MPSQPGDDVLGRGWLMLNDYENDDDDDGDQHAE